MYETSILLYDRVFEGENAEPVPTHVTMHGELMAQIVFEIYHIDLLLIVWVGYDPSRVYSSDICTHPLGGGCARPFPPPS